MWPTASYGIVLVAARALSRGAPLGDLDQRAGISPRLCRTRNIGSAVLMLLAQA